MIVADTNLIAYLLLPGKHTALAEAVLQKDSEWAAPLLWRSELQNIIAGYLRRGVLSLTQSIAVVELAKRQLTGRQFAVSADQVLHLVSQSNCSAYDCEFVGLACDIEVPLVTSDRKILAAFPKNSVSPAAFVG